MYTLTRRRFFTLLAALFLAYPLAAAGQAVESLLALAKKERPAMLDTMKELVEIESGSREYEGLEKIARVVAKRLQALGGKVELLDPDPAAIVKLEDTPERIGKAVRATFTGTGKAKILLLAHMDTVYPAGMLAQQPFKVDDTRAWGLGIADDKQGVAVILHALAMLNALNFRDYGTLTVLVNGDEEISTPGHRALITRLDRKSTR